MRLVLVCISLPLLVVANLEDVYQFKYFDFDYPTEAARQAAIKNGDFVEGNSLAIDVDVYYGKNGRRVFVSAPSFSPGVPATLATVSDKKRNEQNLLAPYPSWNWHTNQKQCKKDRIVSVFRTQIDDCGRIWILDSGRYEDTMVCNPQLLAFDLATDKLVYRYEFPEKFYEKRSYFVTPVVDMRDSCKNIFVYMADCGGFSIVVHDVANNGSWLVGDKTMYPHPPFGTYTISGQSFDLMDGILGLALEPYKQGKDRKLFFHALTSNTENYVSTSQLRDGSQFSDTKAAPHIFTTYKGTRYSQSGPEAIDKRGIQYFAQAEQNSLYCWNTKTEYGGKNIKLIVHDDERLQFNSGMKIIVNKQNKEELWLMTNRLQKAFTGTTNIKEINFRILKVNVNALGCDC